MYAYMPFWKRVKTGRSIAKQTVAFSYTPDQPHKRLLIVGDSTAIGVGAETPEVSVAGHFHAVYPNLEIVNLGISGLKLAEINTHLQKSLTPEQDIFDMVLIMGGANDIIYFTPLAAAKEHLEQTITTAQQFSDNVVLITSGNIGIAPLFPWPLNTLYTHRSHQYLTAYKQTAQARGVHVVDVYHTKHKDPLGIGITNYYCPDLLHFNGTGYKLWFEAIQQTIQANAIQL